MLISSLEHMTNVFFSLKPRTKPIPSEARQARLIAHRGAHNHKKGIIENTMESFRLAKKFHMWGIEFDVRTTLDNRIVVHHDLTLKRLWGQDLAIADLNFEQLRALRPEIPTLDEVVTTFGGDMHLFIELKKPFKNDVDLSLTLNRLTPCKDYHILSLDPTLLIPLSRFPKQSLLLVPILNNVRAFCEQSIKEHYGGVLGNYILLTNALIQTLKSAHQVVGVGFVDSKFSLYRELNRGISLLFTNKAEKISQYLQDLW